MKKLLVVCIVLGVLLSGCSVVSGEVIANGQVYALSFQQTIAGVLDAINGSANTLIMRSGNLYLFSWYQNPYFGFVCYNCAAETSQEFMNTVFLVGKGNVANSQSFAELIGSLLKNGWEIVPNTGVPAVVSKVARDVGVVSGNVRSVAEYIAKYSPKIMLAVPVGVFDDKFLQERYGTIEH